jgi:hypothetical protein
MKRAFPFLLCGILCACSTTVPVTGQTSAGEIFKGEATASLSEGTFHVAGPGGKTCSGTYDQWSLKSTLSVEVNCSDGRHGTVLVVRDATLTHGTGAGYMNDGTKFTFTLGE